MTRRMGDRIGPDEQAFIETRESFYLASVGSTGWPYLQHRGGPPGFLRVLGERTLGFADFRGNRRYITVGNLDHDDRVSLFLMDYAHQARMKILGRARTVDGDSPLAVEGYRA
ncbi:pyridoxamine 5'-phosphate oxidase family protein [Nonomuraea sp. NPDC050310]|uniref:pyridoxamine 5'-phosphate oxidase family protein n=1 Tax=Nonomuraea sp. NPDC050310 TaxID=3154935 RepID=UPI00340293AD